MKRRFLFPPGIFLFLAIIIAGCEDFATEADDLSGEDLVTIAEDEIYALKSTEAAESDISSARFGGHLFRGGMKIRGPHLFFGKHFPGCAGVRVNGEDFPREIIIDYTDGCMGRLGLEKKGTITLVITDKITEPGATYTVTYEDVIIGNRQVDRIATVTNQGVNEDGNWVISLHSVTTVYYGDTLVIVRDFEEWKEWLNGFDTPQIADDRFLKTGGGTITVNNETVFERSITRALLIDRSCMFPLSGIIEITKYGEQMTIDFGEGECDSIAVVTKDGESEEIELIRGRFRKGFHRKYRHLNRKNGWW